MAMALEVVKITKIKKKIDIYLSKGGQIVCTAFCKVLSCNIRLKNLQIFVLLVIKPFLCFFIFIITPTPHELHVTSFMLFSSSSSSIKCHILFQHFMVMFRDEADPLSALSTINCILHVLLRYFHLTNFFWMFVEGNPVR